MVYNSLNASLTAFLSALASQHLVKAQLDEAAMRNTALTERVDLLSAQLSAATAEIKSLKTSSKRTAPHTPYARTSPVRISPPRAVKCVTQPLSELAYLEMRGHVAELEQELIAVTTERNHLAIENANLKKELSAVDEDFFDDIEGVYVCIKSTLNPV